jgi:hypothetical protein
LQSFAVCRRHALALVALLAVPLAALPDDAPAESSKKTSKFIDPQDGWFDVSSFLDTAYGFVPIVVPITEPAVGYGAGGGLVFISRPKASDGKGVQKPNITAVGGMATENGSKAAFGADSRSWFGGRLETLVAAGYGSINLDFYGIGDGVLANNPLGYNLEPAGGLLQARYRMGDGNWRVGLAYAYADTKVSFDSGLLPPQISLPEIDSQIGGLMPQLIYDTRAPFFTPNGGTYAEASVGIMREALGGSSDFETGTLVAIHYWPVLDNLTLGVKAEANLSFDDAPFYTRPFINLRGVAIRRYVGEYAADVEVEARWQRWGRFSLIGFAGTGIAWSNDDRFDESQTVVTGGLGFRYEVARRYGLHMGLDVAFGPDDPALYVQFGNAWFRP